MSDDFTGYMAACQARLERALPQHLGQETAVAALREAMRYSLLNGGKRVRPLLVYAAAEAVAGSPGGQRPPADALDAVACAVECIHAYSLIHDDLPAMDNDDLRRGLPTCHRQFGEALAILAGDALQARAFELLSTAEGLAPGLRLQLVAQLAAAAGGAGMAGGQALDVTATGTQPDLAALERMHALKTGALIRAAVGLGAHCGGADPGQLASLDRYAQAIGLCFQVQDDILDVTAATEVLGKTAGADARRQHPTYPAVMGLESAQAHARSLHDQALSALGGLGPSALRLRQVAGYILGRGH